jgi:hypothetical protein
VPNNFLDMTLKILNQPINVKIVWCVLLPLEDLDAEAKVEEEEEVDVKINVLDRVGIFLLDNTCHKQRYNCLANIDLT